MSVSLVEPGQKQRQLIPRVERIGPRAGEWLPDILEELLPACVRTVRALARDHETTPRGLLVDRVLYNPGGVLGDPTADDLGVSANGGIWAAGMVRWTDRYAGRKDEEFEGVDERQIGARDSTRAELTAVGPGADLDNGPIALLEHADPEPSLVVSLDGPAWVDLEDRRTGERALDVLMRLSSVVDLRVVASPRVLDELRRRWPDVHDRLTEGRDETPQQPLPGSEDDERAYDLLSEWGDDTGRVRLIRNLPVEGGRTVEALKEDDALDVSASTVDVYVSDLQGKDVVDVDVRTTESNVVSLSSFGLTLRALISPDYRIQHPSQVDLSARLIDPSQAHTGKVYRAGQGRGDPPGGLSAEEWLSSTGEAEDEGGFTQWMDAAGCRLDAPSLHRRLAAGKRVDGVTCVDEPVQEFEDGRVSYVSIFEDELQTVLQWGGAGFTTVRLAAALSSSHVWGKILTRDVVGDDLSKIAGPDGLTDEDIEDIVLRGRQIGWLSADEDEDLTYDALREAMYKTSRRLLGNLGTFVDGDQGDKAELLRDAIGLTTCMTTLLHAVGVDVTVHVRVPDVPQLMRDDSRRTAFVNWFKHVLPKQTAYGVHNGYRNVVEPREDKLRYRLPMHVDETDAAAEMTASVVVSGRGASELIPDLSTALEGVEPREAIANGDERSIHLRIPVVGNNSFHAIRDLVDEVATRKGWMPTHETLTRATRVLVGAVGRGQLRASPFVVAEALDAIASTSHPDVPASARFDVEDVHFALSTLPAKRLFPDATPTVQAMTKVLLAADEPLSPAELRAEADISEASYYRHAATMESLDLLTRDETDGHVWTLDLEPWWARASTKDRPDRHMAADLDAGDGGIQARRFADEMLFELALAMPGNSHLNPVWSGGFGGVRGVDKTWLRGVNKIAEEVPELAPWVPWVTALVEEIDDQDSDVLDEPTVVVVGSAPAATDPSQTALV